MGKVNLIISLFYFDLHLSKCIDELCGLKDFGYGRTAVGLIVVTRFISPYYHERDRVRNSVAREGDFIEVYLNCPVEECEKRDVKGLYAKARAGKIKDFTGISAPYEIPVNPDLIIDSVNDSVEVCVRQVTDYLEQKGYLDNASRPRLELLDAEREIHLQRNRRNAGLWHQEHRQKRKAWQRKRKSAVPKRCRRRFSGRRPLRSRSSNG